MNAPVGISRGRKVNGGKTASSREEQWAGYEYIFKEPFEPTIELTKDGIIESGVYVRRKVVLDIAQDRVNALKTGQQAGFEPSTSANGSDGAPPNKTSTSRGPGRPPLSEQSKRLKASARQARWRAKKAEVLVAAGAHQEVPLAGNTV